MLFELFGNKSTGRFLHDIYSKAWHNYKDDPERPKARKQSEEAYGASAEHAYPKLSKLEERGNWIAEWAEEHSTSGTT